MTTAAKLGSVDRYNYYDVYWGVLSFVLSSANEASSVLKPDADKSMQHLQPPSDSIQRRYSDSSVADGRHSDYSPLPPQSESSHKLFDTTAPGAKRSTPSNDDYLHLPSPPSSPMLHHRKYQKILSTNSCKGIIDNFHVCVFFASSTSSHTCGSKISVELIVLLQKKHE